MREHDVSLLMEALPYIRRFRDALFVVKLGGELLQERTNCEAIAGDLTLLHMVGIRIVVVHGGGPQATELSKTLGLEPKMIGGRRVTDEATLEVAKMVFRGKLNTELLAALSKHGALPVGLSGVDGGLVRARKRPVTTVVEDGQSQEIDFGFVGDIDSIDPRIIRRLVEDGFLPVVSSLAADKDGNVLNVNADTIAAELAIAAKATKLIALSAVPGVLRKDGLDVIARLNCREIDGLVADGTIRGGMIPKVASCRRAVEGGVVSAHILDGRTPHALLQEVFTDTGIGTMMTAE